jgi:hypothetical protein
LRLATAARETVGENAWHGWSLACGASRFFFVAIVSAKESLGGSSVNVDWGDAQNNNASLKAFSLPPQTGGCSKLNDLIQS